MSEKKIERLPVVDDDVLRGIVTKDRLLRCSPSGATSLSLHEIHYLFAKLTVGEIMEKNLVTVTPDTTVENAVRLAQEKGVGCLPVVEQGRITGIVTTNDFFYFILNPLLGIGEQGSRVLLRKCTNSRAMAEALTCIADLSYDVLNAAYLPTRRGDERDFVVHVRQADVTRLVECMREKGIEAEERQR
jgi:acetoin utilization protein AcuB